MFVDNNVCLSQARNTAYLYASYLKGVLSDIYGNPRRALEEYLKLKQKEQVPNIDLRMAIDYIKIRKYSNAANILERMCRDTTINAEAYVLLSLTYAAWGKKLKAEAVYEEFLQRLYALYPENIKVAEALAELQLKKGNLAAAEKIYLSLLAKNQKSVSVYLGLAYIYDEKKEMSRAITLLKEALSRNPDNPELLNSLAYIYAEAGINLDKAEVMVKKALEREPDAAAYLDSLGWIYYRKQVYELALKYLEQASKLSDDPLIKEHLGDVLYALGRYSQAIRCWRQIINIKGFPAVRRQVLEEKIKQARHEQRKK